MHASTAEAWPVIEGSVEVPQAMEASGGTVSVGAVRSTTVIVCTPVTLFPQASVAFHVRTMVPVPPQPARFTWSVYVIVAVKSLSP